MFAQKVNGQNGCPLSFCGHLKFHTVWNVAGFWKVIYYTSEIQFSRKSAR